MSKAWRFFNKFKKAIIIMLVFAVVLFVYSINYVFAAPEPVRSITLQSEHTNYEADEEGSWQVTKSGEWSSSKKAKISIDVDTNIKTKDRYTDIIFVLDNSASMVGEKLMRVKLDTNDLIDTLLVNPNNRAALISFNDNSSILSNLTNDRDQLVNTINSISTSGDTNYYKALLSVESILQTYQQEKNRDLIVLFLTDGYPNVETPNEVGEYRYLKQLYPYITINGIQYEMGSTILDPIKQISDNQYFANMVTLNNVLFDAGLNTEVYEEYEVIDYIDNDYFSVANVDDIVVNKGTVELTEENGKQKVTWKINEFKSGTSASLTMTLDLKDNIVGAGGLYLTNESTTVLSSISDDEENVTTTKTPILSDNYTVTYDGNVPEGCIVPEVPEAQNYNVFDIVEISSEVPTCEGYRFLGWKVSNESIENTIGKNYFAMPEEDVEIKAEWSKVTVAKSMNGTVNDKKSSVLKSYAGNSNEDFHNTNYNAKITSIVTKTNLEIPVTAVESWDVSEAGDGSVIAYLEDDGRGAGTYRLTIGGQDEVIANVNSNNLFYGLTNVESIDLTYLNIDQTTSLREFFASCSSLETIIYGENWNMSNITNISYMFYGCTSLTSVDLSSFNTSKVTNLSYLFYNCSNLSNVIFGQNFDTKNVTTMSRMFYNCAQLLSLDLSMFNTSNVTNMYAMFYQCSNITSITFGLNWNTKNLTDMGFMFTRCKKLSSLDVSMFDTANVINMNSVFNGCSALIELDLSNFNAIKATDMGYMFAYCSNLTKILFGEYFVTENVTTMASMFRDCSSLSSLDLSSFDTSQVTDMSWMFGFSNNVTSNLTTIAFGSNFNTENVTTMYCMFRRCIQLLSVDLSGFNTSQVTNMATMFYECNNITSIKLSSNFDTSQVTDMSFMFARCYDLASLDISMFDTSKVTNMNSTFNGCSSLTGLNINNFDTSQVTNMSYMFYNCSSLSSLDLNAFNTSKVTDMSFMFGFGNDVSSNLTTITFGPNFDTGNVTTMYCMFRRCTQLLSLDLSNFDTSQVTNMATMFYECNNITSIKFSSNFDTRQVTDMSFMFARCYDLASLDVSMFDTSKVTNMSDMFENCSSLTNLSFSNNFDTSQVTNMSYMFAYCSNLGDLNLINFDTANVKTMNSMFYGCHSLEKLDLSSFDTSQVTDMSDMFSQGHVLSEIIFGEHWDTSKVVNMSRMFAAIPNITHIDVSHFDTSSVTNMKAMFDSCYNLSDLDLSNFDTSKVENMSYMFRSSSLTELDLSNFDTSQVMDMNGMFWACRNLINLDMRNAIFNATSYSSMFYYVPNGINVIVKDATAKTWIEARLSDESITGTVTIASV